MPVPPGLVPDGRQLIELRFLGVSYLEGFQRALAVNGLPSDEVASLRNALRAARQIAELPLLALAR